MSRPHTSSRMDRRWRAVLFCAAAVAWLSAAANAQLLDLDPAVPPRMPTAGIERRIARLQEQISQLARVAQTATDPDERLTLRARMFVRAAAVGMPERGGAEPYAPSSPRVG